MSQVAAGNAKGEEDIKIVRPMFVRSRIAVSSPLARASVFSAGKVGETAV